MTIQEATTIEAEVRIRTLSRELEHAEQQHANLLTEFRLMQRSVKSSEARVAAIRGDLLAGMRAQALRTQG